MGVGQMLVMSNSNEPHSLSELLHVRGIISFFRFISELGGEVAAAWFT